MNEPKENYQNHPIITVRILSVRPGRLLVRLPGNRGKGVIPKSEWTWDRSVEAERPFFAENQTLEVVLLPNERGRELPFLSIREKENPWAKTRDLAVGAIREGEVINIRRTAVYVQLRPGIVAVLWAKEIPLLFEQLPGDLLVSGDRIRVEITLFDPENRRLEISMLIPLRYSPPEDQLADHLTLVFQDKIARLRETVEFSKASTQTRPRKIYLKTEELTQLHEVLLVENNERDAKTISAILFHNFEVKTYKMRTGREALAYLKGNAPDLIVLDLDLDHGENGITVAEDILTVWPGKPILFISNNPFANESIEPLEEKTGRVFPFATKEWYQDVRQSNTGTLSQAIQNLQDGFIERYGDLSRKEQFITQQENTGHSNLPLAEKLQLMLNALARETLIDYAVILHLDKGGRAIRAAALYPPGKAELFQVAMDTLYYSPVREVIEEGALYYSSGLDEEKSRLQIHNFFENIFFRSCYGLPIRIGETPTQYALFALNKAPDLTWDAISRIRLTAAYASIAIERDQFLNALRPKQDMALRGELMATFIHEFGNRLEPLFDLVEEGQKQQEKGDPQSLWDYMLKVGADLLKLKDLSLAYGRLAKAEFEAVDLNQIVEKVRDQLQPYARAAQIRLEVRLHPLPPVKAISIQIEQVLTNVVLNAIQHVDEQNKIRKAYNERHGLHPEALLASPKMVLIKTCTAPETNACCIMVVDTGGGVPYNLREKIFNLGVSSREGGHGLGLFISRNLTEAMRGKLEWVHSLRGYGSAFALVFPDNKINQEANGAPNE